MSSSDLFTRLVHLQWILSTRAAIRICMWIFPAMPLGLVCTVLYINYTTWLYVYTWLVLLLYWQVQSICFFLVFSLSSFTYSHRLAGNIFKALAVDCVWLCAIRYCFFYFLNTLMFCHYYQLSMIRANRPIGYERVYLPLCKVAEYLPLCKVAECLLVCKVADNFFHIQGGGG